MRSRDGSVAGVAPLAWMKTADDFIGPGALRSPPPWYISLKVKCIRKVTTESIKIMRLLAIFYFLIPIYLEFPKFAVNLIKDKLC